MSGATRLYCPGMVLIGQLAGLAMILLAFGMSHGCQRKLPPSAASNQILTPGESRQKPILTEADESAALDAMRAVAAGHSPTAVPGPARHGVRWSDMHAAVIEAVVEREIGIFRYKKSANRIDYVLRTIDDQPGTLEIRRTGDERVYEATASIGRFGNVAAERALLDELEKRLRAFGSKRQFPDD